MASTVETQKRGLRGLISSSPVTERHGLRADAHDDTVIDLARQQAQRKADDPAVMRDHSLDGEM